MALPTSIPNSGDNNKRPRPTSVKKVDQDLTTIGLPSLEEISIKRESKTLTEREKLRIKIDPKTGVKYRELPKTELGADERPILAVPDFDSDDLNSEALEFLGHLQVAPSKEERDKIRIEREKRVRKESAID